MQQVVMAQNVRADKPESEEQTSSFSSVSNTLNQ